jgi:hypothetical protein
MLRDKKNKSLRALATTTNLAKRLRTRVITFTVTSQVKKIFTNSTLHSVGKQNQVKITEEQSLTRIVTFMEQNQEQKTQKASKNVRAATSKKQSMINVIHTPAGTLSSNKSKSLAGVRQSRSTTVRGLVASNSNRQVNRQTNSSRIGIDSSKIDINTSLMPNGGLSARLNTKSTSQGSRVTSTHKTEGTLRRTLTSHGTHFSRISNPKCLTYKTLASLEKNTKTTRIMRARNFFLTVKLMSQ